MKKGCVPRSICSKVGTGPATLAVRLAMQDNQREERRAFVANPSDLASEIFSEVTHVTTPSENNPVDFEPDCEELSTGMSSEGQMSIQVKQ